MLLLLANSAAVCDSPPDQSEMSLPPDRQGRSLSSSCDWCKKGPVLLRQEDGDVSIALDHLFMSL